MSEGMPGKPPAAPPSDQQPMPVRDFPVDTSGLMTGYANFARVTIGPEELILDFGLNTQINPNPNEPVKLTHRLVVNYYTAKRLMGLLQMSVHQHENVFGVLETDVQKRVRNMPRPPGQQTPPGQR